MAEKPEPKVFSINEDGIVVDREGNPVKFGIGESGDAAIVKVDGALTKTQVNKVVQERLARSQERIIALEEAAKKAPELQQLLEKELKEKSALEKQIARAKAEAESHVKETITQLTQRASKAEEELSRERAARLRDQLTTQLISYCGNTFINPVEDVIPKLLKSHKREPKLDSQGQPIQDEFVDLYEVEYVGDDGKQRREYFPGKKAIEVFASQKSNLHYLAGSSKSGSGGFQRPPQSGIGMPDFSKMSPVQKIQYGLEQGQLGNLKGG